MARIEFSSFSEASLYAQNISIRDKSDLTVHKDGNIWWVKDSHSRYDIIIKNNNDNGIEDKYCLNSRDISFLNSVFQNADVIYTERKTKEYKDNLKKVYKISPDFFRYTIKHNKLKNQLDRLEKEVRRYDDCECLDSYGISVDTTYQDTNKRLIELKSGFNRLCLSTPSDDLKEIWELIM